MLDLKSIEVWKALLEMEKRDIFTDYQFSQHGSNDEEVLTRTGFTYR